MEVGTPVKTMDALGGEGDIEKKTQARVQDAPVSSEIAEAPRMTFRRFIVLVSLAALFIGGGIPVIFLGAGLCTSNSLFDEISRGQHTRWQILGERIPKPGWA